MKDFLGRGFGFPLSVDGHGSIRMSSHEMSVKESVRLILGTPVGERMMAPDFGCKIHDLVFHPNDPNTAAMAALYVKTSLRKWEPTSTPATRTDTLPFTMRPPEEMST